MFDSPACIDFLAESPDGAEEKRFTARQLLNSVIMSMLVGFERRSCRIPAVENLVVAIEGGLKAGSSTGFVVG